MSQATLGAIPGTTSGPALAALLRAFEAAIQSTNEGTVAPTYAVSGTLWKDTSVSPPVLRHYTGTVWEALFEIGDNKLGVKAGVIEEWAGIDLPDGGYLWADGSAESRTTYATLFGAITKVVTGTTVNGSGTISAISSDVRSLGLVGAAVEGTGIPSNATITAISATSWTISPVATANGTLVSLRILPWGRGDGSTTFNVPNKKGRVSAGRGDMGGTDVGLLTTGKSGVNGTKLGATGGLEDNTLTTAQLAAHTHTASSSGTTSNPGNHNHSFSDSGNTGSNGSHNHDYQRTSTDQIAPSFAGGGATIRIVNNGTPEVATDTSTDGSHTHTFSVSGNTGSNGSHTHTLSLSTTVDSAGGGTAHNNTQPTLVTNFIVKT